MTIPRRPQFRTLRRRLPRSKQPSGTDTGCEAGENTDMCSKRLILHVPAPIYGQLALKFHASIESLGFEYRHSK